MRICTSPTCRATFIVALGLVACTAMAAPSATHDEWDSRGPLTAAFSALGGGIASWLMSKRGGEKGAAQGAERGLGAAVDSRLNALDQRFNTQDTDLGALRRSQEAIRREQTFAAATVRGFAEEIRDSIAAATKSVQDEITKLRHGQELLDARLDGLERRRSEKERFEHEHGGDQE